MDVKEMPELLDDTAPLPHGLWERLAKTAQEECWDTPTEPFGILSNLIRQHYRRLRSQGKLYHNRDGQVFMNTSLRTRETKVDIILAFLPDTTPGSGRDRKPYGPPQVKLLGDKELQGATVPMATWFDDPTLRYWDDSLPFNYNIDHIIQDRGGRLPEGLLKMGIGVAKGALHGAINDCVERLKRDDTLAVPFIFAPKGIFRPVLQWMLPLYFGLKEEASAALVVERLQHGYRASTILTPPMAYKNARVIRSSVSWLLASVLIAPESEVEHSVQQSQKIVRIKPPRTNQVCAFFQKEEGCTKGDLCRFLHEKKQVTEEPQKHMNSTRAQCPQYSKSGRCTFGDKCWYSHNT
jgi:hypothetical protein